ncbi:zinc finger ZZ-type and EF-hand domain-containing 1 [Chlorella sorokiniana]|uniref:Zinc finger ZZ-type and EF-hand domain-containing 1 n=1 Tax=Chlorella sorokiniana TaxID=3076 RepID=A0A2P6TNT5_CHLSO|nr:zinc finger ZZ-type and EF-hand domain-containing 1 [Chlorella sorokiniana]|eukprot:PRW50983.1 zinc finger ZZ-type and EF-hand domain-containing 1 [Chlorella sorokiniana]
MLAAGLLAQALRTARQRALGRSALAAAGAAALRLLQPNDCGAGACSWYSSCGSHAAAAVVGTCSSSFSSSALYGRGARGSSINAGKPARRKGSEKEPQPQLQAWLQQEQGLSAKAADQHARRLARVFGSQQAALDGLPATFQWCRSHGLTGLQAAQLLDRIAKKRPANVVQFAALVQPVWQLMDSYIAAHIEPLRQAGAMLPKHTSLAEVLCSSPNVVPALGMPPGHVEAWLAAVSERLTAATIGSLLVGMPNVVCGSPTTTVAAISWAVSVLGAQDPAAFFSAARGLLTYEVQTLQRNLDSLQQALNLTAEQARQLVLKQAMLLASRPDTVQAALTWLRQLFPDAAQLADVFDRGGRLLSCSVHRLQGNADTLRQALGWQDGDRQLAAFVAAYPQPFAANDLSSECAAHKLRVMTQVAGCPLVDVLSEGSNYLKTGLETMAAHYMLVQERAPHRLYDKAGTLHLSWVINASRPDYLNAMGISREQRNAFVREWPRSEEGRRLLEGLRAGSMKGWPRPPTWEEAQQQSAAAVTQQQAAAGAGVQQPRRRRSKA